MINYGKLRRPRTREDTPGTIRMYPEETCPVCGRKWTRYCRRSEWGYYYNASESQIESYLTLLCSAECSRKYAEAQLMKDVRKFISSKSGQAIKLIMCGMPTDDALKATGLNNGTGLTAMKEYHWKEIEWLKAHNWEVPA